MTVIIFILAIVVINFVFSSPPPHVVQVDGVAECNSLTNV